MQETHSSKNVSKLWKAEWGHKMWCSHGNTNSRGVAILIRKETPISVHNIVRDEEGRYLILFTTWNNMKVLFVNIYGPNRDEPVFYTKIFQTMQQCAPNYTIMGGDLNLAIDLRLDRQATRYNNDKSAEGYK